MLVVANFDSVGSVGGGVEVGVGVFFSAGE